MVFGLGTHLDAVRSTKKTKVFTFGHVWVVFAVVVPVPFAIRQFALPVLFRLYRTEKDCAARGLPHRTKTDLAHEMLHVFLGWLAELDPARQTLLAVDNGYANRTVLAERPATLGVVAAMRPDAALVVAGTKVSPAAVAADATIPWQRVTAWLYGRLRTVECKAVCALWPHVFGTVTLRIVVVRCVNGTLPLRVFFCTELEASLRAVLEHYAGTRWPIEVTFRDWKQLLGLAHAAVRLEAAVLRVAPFTGLQYTLVVLWALRVGLTPASAVVVTRPWYRHKRTLSFADLLATVRKILAEGNLYALEQDRRRDAAAAGHRLPHARPRLKRAA
jgi:hypothetical protein